MDALTWRDALTFKSLLNPWSDCLGQGTKPYMGGTSDAGTDFNPAKLQSNADGNRREELGGTF